MDLRVAVVSTCLYSVPPRGRHYGGYAPGYLGGYGGESQVYSFVQALCRLGVDVELYAVPGSQPPPRGRLHLIPQGSWTNVFEMEKTVWDLHHVEFARVDIVHDWTLGKLVHHLAYKYLDGKAVMTPWGTGAPPPFHRYNTVCWSKFHRGLFLQQGYPESTRWVHGAVDPDAYTPNGPPGDYLLYLSRTHPTKHPEIAVRLARDLGVPLIFAADTESPDHIQYLNAVRERTKDMPNVSFVIDPTFEEKVRLYQGARAFILPSESECFGLVVAEALACGTPVLLRRDGAFPEMITHGVHGFLCDDLEDYVSAAKNLDLIDRGACRRLVEDRFTTERMAREYVQIYEGIAGGASF